MWGFFPPFLGFFTVQFSKKSTYSRGIQGIPPPEIGSRHAWIFKGPNSLGAGSWLLSSHCTLQLNNQMCKLLLTTITQRMLDIHLPLRPIIPCTSSKGGVTNPTYTVGFTSIPGPWFKSIVSTAILCPTQQPSPITQDDDYIPSHCFKFFLQNALFYLLHQQLSDPCFYANCESYF